jgi:IS5 family transposase
MTGLREGVGRLNFRAVPSGWQPERACDITQAQVLLHGKEDVVFADSGYRGIEKRNEVQDQHPDTRWHIAMMPGKRKKLDKSRALDALLNQLETVKTRIRAKIKHPFRVIKCQFGHRKVRYKGLAKNTSQLLMMFALSNLWMVRKRILQAAQA